VRGQARRLGQEALLLEGWRGEASDFWVLALTLSLRQVRAVGADRAEV